MLDFIHLEGFKGFRDTTVGPLRKVNLIVGGQNVGKTSLLEYVYQTWTGQASGNVFRVQPGEHSFEDTDKHSESDRKNVSAVVIPCFLPMHEDMVKRFSQLVMKRRKEELLELLRKIDPRLTNLELLAPQGWLTIFVSLEGLTQMLSLPELGHGFSRLMHIYSTLLSTDAKLALIDEVENGIHYSALPILLQGIKNVAQMHDVQTLMTTHSWDCIRAACEVFVDSPGDFQVIRLERTKNNIHAVCIDGERMLRLMADEREVR